MRVNVDSKALNEPRIKRMARRLNISHFEVLARCIHVWMVCYERRIEFLADVDADIAAGELHGFVDAMIAEEMADRVDERTIRVRGVVERINFLEQQSEKGKLSGRARRHMSDELQKRTSVQQGFAFGSTGGSTEPRTYPLTPDLDQAPDQAPDHVRRGRVVQPIDLAQNGQDPDRDGAAPPLRKTQPGAAGEAVDHVKGSRIEPPDEAFTLAHLLMQSVAKNNPGGRLAKSAERLKQQTCSRWAGTIDKLNRIDGFTWGEIEGMIQWSQRHTFWSGNVQGADALREHWDQMAAQRARPAQARHPNEPRPGPTELAHRELAELRSKAAVP